MSNETVIWITIAVYAVFILAVGFWSGRKSKTITDFTVGGRNAGAWVSAFSYGTAYFSAVMFIGYAGKTGWDYGLWAVLPGIGNAIKASGNTGVIGVGFDKSDAIQSLIRDGYLLCTMAQNPDVMGYEGVQAAVKAIAGEDLGHAVTDTGVSVLTKDSLQ